mgnify:CR=1 FL=1
MSSFNSALFDNLLSKRTESLPVPQATSSTLKSFLSSSKSIILILTSTFEQVLLYAGISLIITTVFTVLALFAHRIKKPGSQKTYEVIGFPITPLLYLAINAWILYYSFQKAFIESLIGCGIFLIGIILYFVMHKIDRD